MVSKTRGKNILTRVTENRLFPYIFYKYFLLFKESLYITKKMTNASVKEKSNGFEEESYKILNIKLYDNFLLL